MNKLKIVYYRIKLYFDHKKVAKACRELSEIDAKIDALKKAQKSAIKLGELLTEKK